MPKDKKAPQGSQQRAKSAPYNKNQAVKSAAKGKGKTAAKSPAKPAVNPLFEKRPRNFGIGQAIQPKRDLTRFVRWPKYVRMQRQKRVLYSRLKVPPSINQFTNTLGKSHALQLFALLDKYKPETKQDKNKRLKAKAEAVAAKKEVAKDEKRPDVVKYGINHVTSLVESKEAKLVLIAHDVDPIELVLWLPALCRKVGVPYVIVKGKARLGRVVNKKTATVLALTSVSKADEKQLEALQTTARDNFNNNEAIRKTWGGGVLGKKSIAATRKKTKAAAALQVQ
jgi:large subunit ribosomal protein L7Ae